MHHVVVTCLGKSRDSMQHVEPTDHDSHWAPQLGATGNDAETQAVTLD